MSLLNRVCHEMHYPVANPAHWNEIGKLSLRERFSLALRERRYRSRATPTDGIRLEQVSGAAGSLDPSEVVLLCAFKNGMKYLPSLLAHYRRIGVARMAFVDDQSTDESAEFLAAQKDVDLFRSNVGFRDSEGGLVWRDLLVQRYGRDRWYVSVDCDEYLIYPDFECRPLSDLIAALKENGLRRILAPMIDLYPDGSLGAIAAQRRPTDFPTEICPLLDGADYRITDEKFCTAVRGGPRLRLFGTDMRLSKFPLLFADRETQFAGGSHHGPLPLRRNFAPPRALLLHYKFPEGALDDFRTIAKRGTHFGGSQFYREIVEHPAFNETADFRYPHTRRYIDSRQMLADGFMQDIMRS